MSSLTPRQRAVLDAIRAHLTDHGYPPTIREIADVVGLASPASVRHQLGQLQRKGYLRRDPARPRALVVLDAGERL